jgi:hypothetical protein
MKIDTKAIISEHMRAQGKKGGTSTRDRYGREYFVNIAKSRKGMTWKWGPDKKGKRAKGLQKREGGSMIPLHVNVPK